MTEKLFLHIGSPKAASTYVQRYLHQNADRLRALRFAIADNDLRFTKRTGNPIWFLESIAKESSAEARRVITSRLAALRGRTAIISAENLSEPAMAGLFADAARKFEIHVLYIIRRQDSWIYSAWKQWFSKGGQSLDAYVAAALRRHEPNYPATVEAWAEIVGRDHIQVVSLDTLGDKGLDDVVLGWLDLESQKSQFSPLQGPENESFDFRIVDLLSRNHGAYDDPHDMTIDQFLTRYSALALRERYRLPEDMSAAILRHFHDDNVLLVGEDEASTLASRVASGRSVAEWRDSQSQHEFVIACLLEAMGKMAKELEVTRRRLAALERQLTGEWW